MLKRRLPDLGLIALVAVFLFVSLENWPDQAPNWEEAARQTIERQIDPAMAEQ